MTVIQVVYSHREGGEELIGHEKHVTSHTELCDIIDAYPWESEIELFERYGEGGGLHFYLTDQVNDNIYACYQLTPIGKDIGSLVFWMVLKPGFLNIFGRKSAFKDFDVVSINEAKSIVEELFVDSIDFLYEKYRK